MKTTYLETEHQELFYLGVDLHRSIAVHVPSALGVLAYYVARFAANLVRSLLAGMGYDSQKELAGMGYGSQKDLAGMGFQSQKDLQTLGGQQTLSEMRESARLKEQQDVIAFLRQQGLKSQADWEQRQKQNQMSNQPYYDLSNRQNLVPYGKSGVIWNSPSRR